MSDSNGFTVGIVLGFILMGGAWFGYYMSTPKTPNLHACAKENRVYECKLYALPILEDAEIE